MELEIITVMILRGNDQTVNALVEQMTKQGWNHAGYSKNEVRNAGITAPQTAPTFSRERKEG